MAHKLGIFDLDFRGAKVPKVKTAVTEAICDLHRACTDEGATDLPLPSKPLTYTALVLKLKELGLVSPPGNAGGDIPPPPPPPPAAPQHQQEEAEVQARVDQIEQESILANHHQEVNKLYL